MIKSRLIYEKKGKAGIAAFFIVFLIFGSFTLFPTSASAQVGCAVGAGAAAGAAGAAAVAVPPGGGWPVSDAAVTIISKASLVANTKIAADSSVQSTIMCVLNGLAWTVAKTAVQSLTKSTVNWINSGFQGSPAFVTDLNQNLSMLGDTIANDFLNNLSKTATDVVGVPINVRSPYQDQIASALRTEYYRATSSALGFDGRNPYTLGKTTSNPLATTQGDLKQGGGINGWFALSQKMQNNPVGRYQLAENELWRQIDVAAKNRLTEIGLGRGFLPWRGSCANSKATTLSHESGHSSGTDASGKAAQDLSLASTDPSVGCSVRTPGAVIESTLEHQLGSGVRQLELADSINEIVGALVSQMANQVFSSGGLLGVSQPSAGGGSSYINQASNPTQYTSSISNIVSSGISNDRQNVIDYQTAWQKIKDAASDAKRACIDDNAKATQADAVIVKAAAQVVRAGKALASYDSVGQGLAAAKKADSGADIVSALNGYQNLVQSPDIPTLSEYTAAKLDSEDTGTSTTSPSTYSQMVQLAASCRP